MPWNLFDVGRDVILPPVLDALDSSVRVAVEADLAILRTNPNDYRLRVFDWKGEDDFPFPTKITILAGRVWVRYAVIPGHPDPAILNAIDLTELAEPHPELGAYPE